MCGRFGLVDSGKLAARILAPALRVAPEEAAAQLAAFGRRSPGVAGPRYNIAPSRAVLAILERRIDGAAVRRVVSLQWGLVPSDATDPKIGNRLTLARAETVATLPAFRDAWHARRRCLIPADVFYEWSESAAGADARRPREAAAVGALVDALHGARRGTRAVKVPRQPYAVRRADNAPFCLAGIWEAWRPPAPRDATPNAVRGPWLVTCAVLTTAPNGNLAAIHDRMPVVIPPESYDAWLDRDVPPDAAARFLVPAPDAALHAYRVSTAVNAAVRDDPSVLAPLADDEPPAP